MKFRDFGKNLPFYLFCISFVIILSCGLFAYGMLAQRFGLFPVPLINRIHADVKELLAPSDWILTREVSADIVPIETYAPERLAPGLLMIAGIYEGRDTFVRIMDREGRVVHEWIVAMSDVWPEVPLAVPPHRRPKAGRGQYLHGIELLPDGSIVANFEHISSFRMDACGDVLWKLDNLGHHSVHYSDQGDLWVAAERFVARGPTGYINHVTPMRSPSVQQISETGEILKEIEIIDVMLRNGLEGLLFLSSINNLTTLVKGDTLHLNDVDIFPADQPSEVFAPGDVMVSLRNINSILVFDPETLKVKFISTGMVLRHHDPDFLPGDRISIFDNRNLAPFKGRAWVGSRIVEIDARTGIPSIVLDGVGENGFFTSIMGVHQRLENGNTLVTVSDAGEVLEYMPDGTRAWRYNNHLAPGLNGRVFMAQVLPVEMDEAFFESLKTQCK